MDSSRRRSSFATAQDEPISGAKAGMQTAMYSAPPDSGVL